jgi:DNA-directed RNA polymerase subunit E'/Rpb7
MRTKYDVGARVWWFDPAREEVVSGEVEGVYAVAEGVFVRAGGVVLPEGRVYSCAEAVRGHFRELFR